jgi:uncharacterized protein YegL
MRRLPIFFLLDVSESMIGTPLSSLEEGMNRIISSLQKDPSALETVFISVIAFAGKAKVISPLTELGIFYTPRLPIGGGTEFGLALDVLMNEIDNKIVPQTKTRQGDWKPIVFLITDGQPTNSANSAVERWLKNYANKVTMVAITLGYNANHTLLKQITPHVLVYEGSSDEDFRRFVDWITASVKTHSQNVEQNRVTTGGIQLAKIGDNLTEADSSLSTFDPNSIILTGRCQSNKRPYLIKYLRVVTEKILLKYDKQERFKLDGSFPISEEYFNWSTENIFEEINIGALEGVPSCPHCGNLSAIASCANCERIMCINGVGDALCPWCGERNSFIYGDGDFTIQRGQG